MTVDSIAAGSGCQNIDHSDGLGVATFLSSPILGNLAKLGRYSVRQLHPPCNLARPFDHR